MKVYDYLYEKLVTLSEGFPDITIKYAFDTAIDRHIVELTPQGEYYNNESLDDAWFSISLKFMSEYPRECISFISDDSILRIENPELIFNAREVVPNDVDDIFNVILNNSIATRYTKEFKSIAPESNESCDEAYEIETINSNTISFTQSAVVNINIFDIDAAFFVNEESLTVSGEAEYSQAA